MSDQIPTEIGQTQVEDYKPSESKTQVIAVESKIDKSEKPNRFISFNLFKINRKLSVIFSIFIRLSIFGFIILGCIFLKKELSDDNYSIHQFNVPQSFEVAGYTGSVVAGRIYWKLQDIVNNERLADVANEYKNTNSVVDLNVDVVGIGVPIRSFTMLVGESLGVNNRKEIKGDVVIDRDTAILFVNITGEVEKHRTSLNRGLEFATDQLVTKAAESILKRSNPYVLARYYLLRDSEGCYKLGKYILNTHKDNADVEPIGYFARAGGYLTDGKYELAEAIVREGLAKYPGDLNLNAALGTMLNRQKRFEESLVQSRKIISMLTESTPINRITRSYMNLAYLMRDLNKHDSAIYYIEKTLAVDSKFTEAYLQLSEHYLERNDTLRFLQSLESGLEFGLRDVDIIRVLGKYPGILTHRKVNELRGKYKEN
jgi:hypothetical protein